MSDDLVKVALRIRPLLKNELEHGNHECLQVIPGEPQVYIKSQDKAFTYNYVFPPSIGQEEFYDTAIKQMIPNIFKGFNVTILAYGQTGSGKTYSMGTNYSGDEDNNGIIPRAVKEIFNTVQNEESDWSYRISVSFIELYQEQLYDLLANKSRNQCIVELREDMKKIVIVGLTERPVNNAAETLSCLAKGSTFRATGATAMNEQSSRSHAVFTITVHQENKSDITNARTSKFHLVDLAGSERSKKTQATGVTFKEGVDINKGLLVLGNVISQLGEGGPGTFVNYRDSKLTRLLQDSLGGNSMTLMIACVSPSDYNIDETLSTLRYADRARKIKNKPIINEDPKAAEVNRLNKIINDLLKQLESGGGACPPEHKELQSKVRSYMVKLNETAVEMIMLHEKLHTAQAINEQHYQNNEKCIVMLKLFIKDLETEIKNVNHDTFRNTLEDYLSRLNEMCSMLSQPSNELQSSETVASERGSISQDDSLDNSDSYKYDNDSLNATYTIDVEHEKHTLRLHEHHSQVTYIDKQLVATENMLATLLKNASITINHEKEIEDMEKEIKKLQTEKNQLEETLQNVQANAKSSKLSEIRRKKIQELEKKISELSKKCSEQMRIIKNKEKLDLQISNLKTEVASMKSKKVALIKQMRTDADRFNKWKIAKEREVNKLKAQDRKKQTEITRLQMNQAKQSIVFKRKIEESQAIQKKYKEALEKHRSAQEMREKFSKKTNTDVIQTQIRNELDIVYNLVDAENNLQKLIQEKDSLNKLLNNAKEIEPKTAEDEACIVELERNLHLKYNEINELEKLIKESNKENNLDGIWKVIKSITDAKIAIQSLIGQSKLELQKRLEKAQQLQEKQEEEADKKMTSFYPESEDIENDNNWDSLKQKLKKHKNVVRTIEKKMSYLKPPSPQTLKVPECQEEYVTDESLIFDDDSEKDPDWKKTPLYHRVQKLDDRGKSRYTLNKPTKRSSGGEVKCSCKTKCKTRICSCRRSGEVCRNCNCDPQVCVNRQEDTKRQLFSDKTNTEEASGIEVKKSKFTIKEDSQQDF